MLAHRVRDPAAGLTDVGPDDACEQRMGNGHMAQMLRLAPAHTLLTIIRKTGLTGAGPRWMSRRW